jgi:hypothetical protein
MSNLNFHLEIKISNCGQHSTMLLDRAQHNAVGKGGREGGGGLTIEVRRKPRFCLQNGCYEPVASSRAGKRLVKHKDASVLPLPG